MKTKNKILAVVEIAIVLCSMLLVALPAIAADRNQTSQNVSASEVTTASEDDYVLGVYGNANEDDTIDMRDLTYVKLIFFGKKPETELADAKYDGKINPLDFIQIKLIIVGKEKEITIVDSADRIVTVKKPIARAVVLSVYTVEAMRMLGVKDKIVGVSKSIKREDRLVYFPEISKLPNVGSGFQPDYEAILSLNPDLVIAYGYKKYFAEYAKKLPGIAIVGLSLYGPKTEELVKLGYIYDKEDEAKHYIDDFHDKYIDLIKERTEKLSEDERQKVYAETPFGPYKARGAGSAAQLMIDIAGGKNIFDDFPGGSATVDPEAVVERNPNIIIKYVIKGYAGVDKTGYGADDPSEMNTLRESIMNRPELASVIAVKSGRVYIIDDSINYGPGYLIGIAYWAKWFYPDLFEDLDPKAIHQEYLTEFQGLDFDVSKHGVFVYHPEEHPDGH